MRINKQIGKPNVNRMKGGGCKKTESINWNNVRILLGKAKIMKANCFAVISFSLIIAFGNTTFGYTPPDCDGCAEAIPGFQYPTHDGYSLYIQNYTCDIEGSLQVNSGDDDPDYGIDMGYVTLDGCDGYSDDAELTYTKRWGTEYSISLGFEVEGFTVGGSVTSSYEEETGLKKDVSCPACKSGDVTARSTRKNADVIVTVKSYRRYDKNVRDLLMVLIRSTPFERQCETSTYNTTGKVYGMAFPEDFEDCPDDENGCPCEVLEE